MSKAHWWQCKPHYSELRDRLMQECFEILAAKHGNHLRLRVCRNNVETMLTMAISPRDSGHAVQNTMQQALRATG